MNPRPNPRPNPRQPPATIALLGNPNTGKTTLFNRLCGERAHTANLAGSTVAARIGTTTDDITIVDLPGTYGLDLEQPESEVCRAYLDSGEADALLIITDVTNLVRNLALVREAAARNIPAVVALNMTDRARRRGLSIDASKVAAQIGCPVVSISALTGEGVDDLTAALAEASPINSNLPEPQQIIDTSLGGPDAIGSADDTVTERLDAAFTHPILGVIVFALVMTGLFYTIFALAEWPMNGIDFIFGAIGGWLESVLPAGAISDLIVNGIVAGIAGTVVFLPQICLLFFLIALLEDTGYLARAAFVIDRPMRFFGLPGQSFIPLLSAHACAIPAIMSARLIPDKRDRLATILIAPFMSCSARLPVYVLLIGILFGDQPGLAALVFAGCYVVGAVAALLSAALFKLFLRFRGFGGSRPMIVELPAYKMPSITNALRTTIDRGWVFLRKAGTIILAICIVLWYLGSYPTPAPETAPVQSDIAAEVVEHDTRTAKAHTFIGRLGRTVEPVFEPMGADWQLSVGILSSFLAREVFVSTMAVVLTGAEEDDAEEPQVIDRIVTAKRDGGGALFTPATSAALLIYYILAMQCLPTVAVTARETGKWSYALLQLGWMCGLAYVLAVITYQVMV